jgi:transcriptional regulator with XRE-family HTH domain
MKHKTNSRAVRRAPRPTQGAGGSPDGSPPSVERQGSTPHSSAHRSARPAVDRTDSPAIDLGRTARRLRESQNLTLADVAGRANISSAMLSRLETGRVSPSLETIVALSQALGVTASILMQRVGADEGGAQLIRAGEGLETVRSGTRRGHTYHLLAAQRGPRKVFEPFLVTLNDRSEVFPGFQHPGVEFIHMLSGILHYRHGRHSYVLKPGDTLTFRGDVAHGPELLEKVPIRMLSLIIYSEEAD